MHIHILFADWAMICFQQMYFGWWDSGNSNNNSNWSKKYQECVNANIIYITYWNCVVQKYINQCFDITTAANVITIKLSIWFSFTHSSVLAKLFRIQMINSIHFMPRKFQYNGSEKKRNERARAGKDKDEPHHQIRWIYRLIEGEK